MGKEQFRKDEYRQRYRTKLFREKPSPDNPFCEESVDCCGYPVLELAANLSFTDYIYLAARQRLPDADESELLRKAAIALSMPGVRHPATRAAVSAGVGKTVPENVLPAALMVLTGKSDGAGSVEASMRFQRTLKRQKKHIDNKPLSEQPGFGLHYGSEHRYLDDICTMFLESCEWPFLLSGSKLITSAREKGEAVGWLWSGLFAAVFCDLGIQPRFAPGLMQAICSPILVAQGMENANQPTTILPFVLDDHYEISK